MQLLAQCPRIIEISNEPVRMYLGKFVRQAGALADIEYSQIIKELLVLKKEVLLLTVISHS